MTNWIEWVNLVLGLIGAVGTAGIAVLVYQWYVDNYSRAPLVFYGPSRGWSTTLDDPNHAAFNLNIRNRRTTPAKVFLLVGPPLPGNPYLTSRNLEELQIWILPGFWPTGLHAGVEVPAKGEVPLAVMAKLPEPDYVLPIRVVAFDQGLRLETLDYLIRPGDPLFQALIKKRGIAERGTGPDRQPRSE